jgi:hypothetical protein
MNAYRRQHTPETRRHTARGSSATVAAALVAALVFSPAPEGAAPASAGNRVYRAFSDSSEWNVSIPKDAPIDDQSGQIIAEIGSYANAGYPRLSISDWSEPIYFSGDRDPSYTVNPASYGPPLVNVHIPAGATAAPSSDGQMTVFDRASGVVFKLHKAVYQASTDTWTADGTSEFDLASNGLDCSLPESNRGCPMNSGHRGIPPAIHAIRYAEVRSAVQGGAGIMHTVKVGLDRTAPCDVYPASGHETSRGGVLTCEGLILRIKPEIDLRARGLSRGCLAIAQALTRYGAVVGDTGGVAMSIKLMSLQGGSRSWSDLGVSRDCFQGKIGISDFEVVRGGYHRA